MENTISKNLVAFNKVEKTISSCEDLDQLANCRQLIENYKTMFNKEVKTFSRYKVLKGMYHQKKKELC